MPPFVLTLIAAIVRNVLMAGFSWLASRGFAVDTADTTNVIVGVTGAVAVLIWSLWEKYGARLKFVTALGMPQSASEQQVDNKIADPSIIKPSVLKTS